MTRSIRILVVEDDRSIAQLLELELAHRGYVVETVGDGLVALEAVARFAPQVIVLDILLPGLDGERVLRELRRQGNDTPVLMLTARDSSRDKVRNLDGGADDYLTKPFDVEELLARLRVIMRRAEPDEELRAGDLIINTATREVRRGARRIDLTGREYDLLELLARNARHVLSRELLLDRLWPAAANPNVVDVYIGYLRRKIDRPGEARLIQTMRGAGFTLRDE
jgi:two-component system response regulator MprA/two-component system response regulator TrcR